MIHYRVFAHYNKNVVPAEYDYWVRDHVTAAQVKTWFKKTYPWLDVYSVKLIPKWVLKVKGGKLK